MLRFVKWLRLVKQASPYRNVFRQLIDIIQTKVRINISPAEYYSFEFYKSDKTWAEKSRYVGKLGSLYWPYELNRLKYNVTLTNKYAQKNLVMGFGLPTPRLITTIGPYFEIKTFDEFQKFLAECSQDIAIKPVSSKGGQSVLILTYRDRRFHMLDEHYTPEKIWQHMQADMKKGFLVEEKMANSRQLADIYPHSLNCFRITTIKLGDYWKEMLPPYLKVGHGKSVVDNISSGGILLFLDNNSHSKMAYAEDLQKEITHHPDTGAPLVGIRFDRVDEVRELGLKASHKFGFMGTIGWDIGLTEVGPVIIEGNGLWGGWEDQKIVGGFITDEMTQHLKKHTFLSRWDRKRMFPLFHRKMKAFRN